MDAPASGDTVAAPIPPPQDTLEDAWNNYVVTKSTQALGTTTLAIGIAKDDDELKPLHPKDVKPPPEFGGARKDFLPWHESFT